MSYNYSNLKTCPRCCGIGLDIDSLDHKCYTCNGTGYVEKCNDCLLRYHCDEQTEFICKHNGYCKYIKG